MNAIAAGRSRCKCRQDGVAAVELALLAALIFWFLASAILIAHSVMQATVVQRAADNAAHMIANYPQYLRSDPSVNLDNEVVEMATEMLVESGIAASAISSMESNCPLASCTAKSPPVAVGAYVSANVMDPSSTLPYVSSFTITASSSDRYAN